MTKFSAEAARAVLKAAELIKSSKSTVVLTGAGFSTPSGIPDFRSQGSGLWTRFLPMEVASLSTFRYDPQKFFAWLQPLASHMVSAQPNAAHYALARLEKAGFIQAIITQNIDFLHQRAGSQVVYEVHGTLNTLTCVGCYHQYSSEPFLGPYIETGEIPYCPVCGGILKPDVILFEEQLPVRTWLKAEEAAQSCETMLVVGTSLEVMPSAGLPIRAVQKGARLIIVNRTSTYADVRADVLMSEDVAEAIPAIAKEVLGEL